MESKTRSEYMGTAIYIKGGWLIKLIELTKSLHSFLKIILTVIATEKTLIANACVCMLDLLSDSLQSNGL